MAVCEARLGYTDGPLDATPTYQRYYLTSPGSQIGEECRSWNIPTTVVDSFPLLGLGVTPSYFSAGSSKVGQHLSQLLIYCTFSSYMFVTDLSLISNILSKLAVVVEDLVVYMYKVPPRAQLQACCMTLYFRKGCPRPRRRCRPLQRLHLHVNCDNDLPT